MKNSAAWISAIRRCPNAIKRESHTACDGRTFLASCRKDPPDAIASGKALQPLQRLDDVARVGPQRVVRTDFRVRNRAVLSDHISSRHRQRQDGFAVDNRQVGVESLVSIDQFFLQAEPDAESVRLLAA